MHRYLPDILTAEDSANDAELSIGALAEYNMANRVVLVSNGADALDYLYFPRRSSTAPLRCVRAASAWPMSPRALSVSSARNRSIAARLSR